MKNNLNVHFQQSEAWQKFQESLGRTVFHESGQGWEYRAILEKARFGRASESVPACSVMKFAYTCASTW